MISHSIAFKSFSVNFAGYLQKARPTLCYVRWWMGYVGQLCSYFWGLGVCCRRGIVGRFQVGLMFLLSWAAGWTWLKKSVYLQCGRIMSSWRRAKFHCVTCGFSSYVISLHPPDESAFMPFMKHQTASFQNTHWLKERYFHLDLLCQNIVIVWGRRFNLWFVRLEIACFLWSDFKTDQKMWHADLTFLLTFRCQEAVVIIRYSSGDSVVAAA